MSISTQTQALLLLSGRFGGADPGLARPGGQTGPSPLDEAEWDRLSGWLKKRGLSPADLLNGGADRLAGWTGTSPSSERVRGLLEREPVLSACLERWEAAGIWAIGRTDPDYPKRLKRRLRTVAPAVLFGSGDRSVLNRGGIALVGGEPAATEAVDFAERFAGHAAGAELSVLSCSRNAVEECALNGSLARGGIAIAVLSGNLMRAVADGGPREAAEAGRLVLVSPCEPEAPPVPAASGPVGRCLYGLADAALLVGAGQDGGAWASAVEAIEQEWVPLWVRGEGQEAARLLRMGAHPLPADDAPPRTLLTPPLRAAPTPGSHRRLDLGQQAPFEPAATFASAPPGPSLVGFAEPAPIFGQDPPDHAPPRGSHLRLVPSPEPAPPPPAAPLFDAFTAELLLLLGDGTMAADAVTAALDLTEAQSEVWLRRAEMAGSVQLDAATGRYRALRTP